MFMSKSFGSDKSLTRNTQNPAQHLWHFSMIKAKLPVAPAVVANATKKGL